MIVYDHSTNHSQPRCTWAMYSAQLVGKTVPKLCTCRRQACLLALAASSLLTQPSPARSALPPEPKVGDCPECIGEVNGGLNACEFQSLSCVSTQNDDEDHFLPPWIYDGSTSKALQRLVDIATGVQLTHENGLEHALQQSNPQIYAPTPCAHIRHIALDHDKAAERIILSCQAAHHNAC